MNPIVMEVLGTPAPKGSSRAILIAGKARNVPSGSNANRDRMRSWDVAVREAAARITGAWETTAPLFVDLPLRVEILFRIARPAGHWGKGKRAGQLLPSAPRVPSVKPDIDKLARATLDALHASVFDDDSRVVELVLRKEYSLPGGEGARITIAQWCPR